MELAEAIPWRAKHMDILKDLSAIEFLFLAREKCRTIEGCNEGCPWYDIEDSDMTDKQIKAYLNQVAVNKFTQQVKEYEEYAGANTISAYDFVKHFKRKACYLGHHICHAADYDDVDLMHHFKALIQAYQDYDEKDGSICSDCMTNHKFRYCPHCGLEVAN